MCQPFDEPNKENSDIMFHESHFHLVYGDSRLRSPELVRTASQPIRFKLKRSDSEEQLLQGALDAEYRDFLMYQRITTGMLSKMGTNDGAEIDPALDSVIRTRHSMRNDVDQNSDNAMHDSHDRILQDVNPSTPTLSDSSLPPLLRTYRIRATNRASPMRQGLTMTSCSMRNSPYRSSATYPDNKDLQYDDDDDGIFEMEL